MGDTKFSIVLGGLLAVINNTDKPTIKENGQFEKLPVFCTFYFAIPPSVGSFWQLIINPPINYYVL